MSLVWHLVKSNIIFNKFRLAFFSLFCLSFSVFMIFFSGDPHDQIGNSLMQNGIYMAVIIFTGKLSAGNKLMFGLKNLHSLPISKQELVFAKSIADIIFFLPAVVVIILGALYRFTEFHFFFIVLASLISVFIANLISLKKRIDFSRTQHSNASFKNSILWFHRILETGLAVAILSFLYAISRIIAGESILMQEYMILILLVLFGFFVFKHTLKLLKDESLSYFFFKRDSIRIGWKIALFLIPTLMFKYIDNTDIKVIAQVKKDVEKIFSFGKEHTLQNSAYDAIEVGDLKKFREIKKRGFKLSWNKPSRGEKYPIHMAILSDNSEMIDAVLKGKEDGLEVRTQYLKRTPAQYALTKCRLNAFEHLVKKGANHHVKDRNGYSLAILAAKSRCYGGLVILQKYGHDLEKKIKTEKGEMSAFQFLPAKTGMTYILKNSRIPSSLRQKAD